VANGVSAHGLIRAMVDADILPADAMLVPRKGRAYWSERELRFQALVEKGDTGNVQWQLFVSDGTDLGLPSEEKGLDATISIREIGDKQDIGRLPWPSRPKLARDEVTYLRESFGAAREFVKDRLDLCFLLTQEHDAVRGALFSWLHQAYPARLVKALMIARDLRDVDRVQEITEILKSGRSWPVSPSEDQDILVVAGRRARELSQIIGRPIEL
jgi:hypothetical protein